MGNKTHSYSTQGDFMLKGFDSCLRFFALMVITLVVVLSAGLFPIHAETASVLADPSDFGFLAQVLALVKSWGGLESSLKISAVVTLIISSIKVSYFKKFWDSLKIKMDGKEVSLQIFIVPILSIVIGLCSQGKVTWAAFVAYAVMGAGAVYLHEIMDQVKKLPLVSPIAKVIVDVISFILGGKKDKPKI